MQHAIHFAAATALAAAALAVSPAHASCAASDIVGTWQDTYGTVATITSQTRGTAIVAGIVCNVPDTKYKLTIKLGGGSSPATARVAGHAPTGSLCPTLHATLTYNAGSCTTASGPLDFNKLELPDIWIKTAPPPHRSRTLDTGLTQGLR